MEIKDLILLDRDVPFEKVLELIRDKTIIQVNKNEFITVNFYWEDDTGGIEMERPLYYSVNGAVKGDIMAGLQKIAEKLSIRKNKRR